MYLVKFPKNILKKVAEFENLSETNEQFVKEVNEALAKEYKKQLLRHIENQDLRWKKLNPRYLKYKIRKGLSPKILKATGKLKDSIKVFETETGWFTGISATERYEDGTPVSLIAYIHEYGSVTRNIPARPLFRPTRRKMLKNINSFVRKKNKKYIKYLLRKLRK